MNYHTRVRLRAIYHSIKLCVAGLAGNEAKIGAYIEIHGNPDVMRMKHMGNQYNGHVIYEIQEAGRGYGFFAEFKTLLENLIFAEKYGFIPCVRYGRNYAYYDEAITDISNPFEYYFEPIGGEIETEKALNVLISKPEYGQSFEFIDDENADGYHFSDNMTSRLAEMLGKYVRIKPDILNRFEQEFNDLIGSQKALGIHYRGTDFKVGYDHHPKQVELQQTSYEVDKAIKERGYTKIFLATDDETALEYFNAKYGDIISSCTDVKRSSGNKSVAFSESDRKAHKYKLGLEVLRDAYFLSKCDGVICGVSQVPFAARLFKQSRGEKYSYCNIIDNGINKNLKSFK